MKKTKKLLQPLFIAAMLCGILLIALVFKISTAAKIKTNQELSVKLTADEEKLVEIVTESGSDYKIIFSSDSRQSDATLASTILDLIRKGTGIYLRATPDTAAESEFEILIGDTNRALSSELLEILNTRGSKDTLLVWGYMYKDGKLAYTANCDAAFIVGQDDFSALVKSDGTISVASDELFIGTKTVEEYEKELADKKAEEEAKALAELIKKIRAFDDSLFGERTPMPSDVYNAPLTYPTVGQHPRLNLRADMLPEIRALLENPDYTALATNFWKDANSDEDGILTDVSTLKVTYNWDGEVLARIEAKALAYLITGDVKYGYQAIYAIKNHMLTLTLTHDIFTDIYKMYGWSMMVAGEVYDWCYDLLTEQDKSQIVRGVQKYYCEDCPCGEGDKMEIGFPPSKMNAIQGHGTNTALQRDYLSFSIAIFDEYPDWWNYVGGRFYQEYVPVNNVFYAAGMVTQGSNNYAYSKLYTALYSSWMIKTMSGELPYDDGLEDVVYGFMGLALPNGKAFQSGDTVARPDGASRFLEFFPSAMYIAQALFPSELMQRYARIYTDNYSVGAYTYGAADLYVTYSTSIIFRANGYNGEVEGEHGEGLDLVWYYGSPMGQMTARNNWSEDAAAVFMKVGELTNSNHDHEDSGTFQIYYKGCFTSESGQYGKGSGYGTSHHVYWHQSTIAHNGLLVYNPALAATENGYYSGSQINHNAPDTLENWLNSGEFDTGEVTGYDYFYNPTSGEVEFAYLAGDISKAYSTQTVDTIERRMLTVYTGDADFPMFFFVYDYIKSKDPSFQKSFLMHTVTEPTVDGNVATYVQNDGKIVLTTLTEDAEMIKIGGEGKTYWINDAVGNVNKDEAGSGTAAGSSGNAFISDGALWGRVQINNVGKLEDHLLNVIYVTDATNENTKTPSRFETDTFIATQLDDYIIVFNKTESKLRGQAEFTTEGAGLKKYYVSGLSSGSWNIKVDGVTVAHTYTSEESGLITFKAPAGNVTLEPGRDVRPLNSDDIKYITAGTALPDDLPFFYVHDVELVLPDIKSANGKEFAGWYIDDAATERIYSIAVGTRGTITLYPKFYASYVEDYEKTKINVTQKNFTIGDYIYWGMNKTDVSYNTIKADDGNMYLCWDAGTSDSQISVKSSMPGFLIDKTAVTFKVDIALDGENAPISSTFRLRGHTNAKTAAVFRITNNGEITLGNDTEVVGKITSEFQTFTFAVDFEKGLIYSYDKYGYISGQTELVLPAAFKSEFPEGTAIDYMRSLIYIYDWYSGTKSSHEYALRVDNLTALAGIPTAKSKGIKYNTNDGIIFGNVPIDFNADGTDTILPTDVTLDGYEFDGWYTTASFDVGTRTTLVPAGYDGVYEVWAKWKKVFIDEDFSSVDIDHQESSVTYAGIEYDGSGVRYSSYKTEIDENGNKYLAFTPGVKAALIKIDSDVESIYSMPDTSISYTITLSKNGDAVIPEFDFQVIGEHTIDGITALSNSNLYLGKINANGEFTLGTSDTVVTSISSDPVTIRIVLDFKNGTVLAYDDAGNVMVSTPMPELPEASYATTHLEWQRCFRDNIFYCKRVGGNNKKRNESIRLYGIKIETGNAFVSE